MPRCERELDRLESAILRLKIGLDRPLDRAKANELAEDLANLAPAFSQLARCVGRTISGVR